MKIRKQILLLAVITAGFTLATQAQAQYRAVGEDGIAASPKLRQMLNDAKRPSGSDSSRVVSYQAVGEDGIAASPKLRQMLNDRKTSSGSDSSRVVSYQAVGEDGISASPKFRQMLREGGTQFQIAPIK